MNTVSLNPTDCPFCRANWVNLDIVDRNQTGSIIAITPLNPVCDGHVLVVHGQHRADAAEDPDQAGFLMNFAAKYVRSRGLEANIIASIGSTAGQNVLHSCVHIVPRHVGDGLKLPWSDSTGAHAKEKKTKVEA